jgi:hypothetical protein
MPDAIAELLITEAAIDKLGARGITTHDARQIPRNAHIVVRNPHNTSPGKRRLLIGRTDGSRNPDAGHRTDHRPDNLANRHRLGLLAPRA